MKRLCIFTALLITVAFLSFEKIYSVDPDCIEMVMCDCEYGLNPDSIMVDTCINSPTYGFYYLKKGIQIRFNNYPFVESPIPLNIKKYWYDIDTNLDILREKLEYISNKYGNFSIVRKMTNEQAHLEQKDFVLEFDSYISWANLYIDVIYSSANSVKSLYFNPPTEMDVKEKDNYTQIVNHGNSLEFNTNNWIIPHNIKIVSAYSNYFTTEYTIANEVIDIPISYLSIGVYFLLIDNTKPIKFIKY